MYINYKRTVDPATEPVDLPTAKQHLEIDHSDRDAYISMLISAAREMGEYYTERSFMSQTWTATADKFPDDWINLLYGDVTAVSSVKYYDTSNVQQTLSSSDYRVDLTGRIARVEPVTSWPETYERIDAIEVTYVAGASSANAVSSNIKQAILMLVGHLFENRQDVVVGSQVNKMPKASEWLFHKEKVYYVNIQD